MNGTGKAPLRGQVGGQSGRQCLRIGARIVGELDGYRLDIALRNGIVKMLYGTFRLKTLVKADKADAFGETCRQGDVR